MKLIVTGGCGFLGSNLAAHGIAQGHDVTVLDNLSRLGAGQNLAWLRSLGGFRHLHADIRNANDVSRAVAEIKPEMVFHLAGQVAMTTSLADPRLDFETNALGTLNLLMAVRDHAPAAGILYSSTNKVYGDLERFGYREDATRWTCTDLPQGFGEDIGLDFQSPYGCSKGCADQYLLDWSRMYGLRTAVFRHSSMYGGRQFATADQGWIGWFCQQAVQQAGSSETSPFTISGDGKQVRDVLHADDMIALYYAAAARITTINGHAFNIGGGIANSLSLLELFSLLEGLVGTRLRYTRLPPRTSDQRVFIADVAKATRMIGWMPKVSAPDGVGRMVAWVQTICG